MAYAASHDLGLAVVGNATVPHLRDTARRCAPWRTSAAVAPSPGLSSRRALRRRTAVLRQLIHARRDLSAFTTSSARSTATDAPGSPRDSRTPQG